MLAGDIDESFTTFVKETEPRLRHALVASLGQDRGLEATSDALAYAFENWDRIERALVTEPRATVTSTNSPSTGIRD